MQHNKKTLEQAENMHLWDWELIRDSQSDNEHLDPPSSPAQRAARCGRISTREEAEKQLNEMLMIVTAVTKSLMDAESGYRGQRL